MKTKYVENQMNDFNSNLNSMKLNLNENDREKRVPAKSVLGFYFGSQTGNWAFFSFFVYPTNNVGF